MELNRRTIGEIMRFAVVGVTATALHYGIYYLLLYVDTEVNLAYAIGYICSFFVNFYLTAYFTFRAKPSLGKGMGFMVAHAVNFLIHIGLLNFFLWWGMPEKWAPLPVFAIAIPVNFLLVRFVFKKKEKSK